jgi:catechol-2,3-dioxygenase
MAILEARLHTAPLDAQRAFYAERLGLPLEEDGADAFAVRAGASLLRFQRAAEGEPKYHFAFNVPANRFAESKAWIAGLVDLVEMDGDDEFDFRSWNAHAVYFHDPAGNIVELISRHGLDNAADAPALLEISEMGMPAPDVHALRDEIESRFGYELYDGGGDSFAAVGDERGLLIVVRAGRTWFPQAGEGRPWPLELTITAPLQADLSVPGLPYRVVSQPAG